MSTVLFAGGGTGGHLYPALALADALRAVRPSTRVHFVGARRGIEARVLPGHDYPYTLLPFEPLARDRVWRNWRLVPAATASLLGLARLFRRERPVLVIGTGGYASGPACGFAVAVGVPIALQEQNSWPGLVIRVMSRFAMQVHLGFPEAARHLRPGRRTEVHALGNPIRAPALDIDRADCRRRFGVGGDATVALVVGGSQGARAVNRALLTAIEDVAAGRVHRPPGMELLWATGPTHLEMVRARVDALGASAWVHAYGYIEDMPRALAVADLALSRAGAMATAELLAWGVPMLLVPLPTAAADHQRHNAQALEQAGAAIHLEETTLTPEQLWRELTALVADADRRERMRTLARERARPNAARDIATELVRILEAA
jgi:UDP-N-acetylglucosamine--N-acetylmuramyl-(pentapeptide) pyrophosphoryl-undecaprenol N-acetylglucosamine transferase